MFFQTSFRSLISISRRLAYVLALLWFICFISFAQRANGQVADSNKVNALIKSAMNLANKPGAKALDLLKAAQYATEGLSLGHKLHFSRGEGAGYIVLLQILAKQRNIYEQSKIIQQAVAFFKNQPFPTQHIDAQLETGNYYNPKIFEELEEKIAYYEIAVMLMRKVDPQSLQLAHGLRNLANLHMYVRKYEPGAVAELKEALAIYKAKGCQELQDIYGLLTGLLSDLDNFREALKYGLLAVNTVEQFKDSSHTALAAYDNLGTLYYGINDYRNAVKYLNEGLLLARKTKNITFTFDITHDLSTTYFKVNQSQKAIPYLLHALRVSAKVDMPRQCLIMADLLSAYTEIGKYDLAQQYILPLLRLIAAIDDEDNPAKDNARRLIIKYFLATRQFSKIPVLLHQSREYAIRRKQIKLLSAVEHYSFKLDSANRQYISAIAHYQKFKALNDSVSSRNQDKQLATLQVQFETEKKNQAIGSLTRETQLQKNALRSQLLARKSLFAGIVLLMLLLALSYNRYKIKQKANHELSEQQEEINTQNDYLKQLVTEREWLLKEIHHRVKNNLQIVISLLNSQSVYLKDPEMLGVFRESQNRMRSISLIHQKLYQGDNLSGIDMFSYTHELAEHLQYSFDTEGKIDFILEIEKITMDVSQAVPIGLILNEAITNAIKYAFRNLKNGEIHIVLKRTENDRMQLTIADNGCGLPTGFDHDRLNSLGMKLMKGLSRQIGAKFELQSEHGLCITLSGKLISVLSSSRSRNIA